MNSEQQKKKNACARSKTPTKLKSQYDNKNMRNRKKKKQREIASRFYHLALKVEVLCTIYGNATIKKKMEQSARFILQSKRQRSLQNYLK